MKKIFAGIACLVVIASGIIMVIFGNHLVYVPRTTAIQIQEPRFAFSLDAGYLVIDQNGKRMLLMDKKLELEWLGSSGSMLGTIIGAVQKPGSSDLYCIDTVSLEGNQYQRLMRIDSLSGTPQETLKQFKVSDNEVFINFSLALDGDALYYLQKDKSGITFLIKRNIANGEEKSLFRTKWNLETARIAIIDASVYILTDGQLFLYKAGILQTIPEIESKLPFIDALCSFQDKLVLVDGVTGTLYSYSQNGLLTKLTEAPALLSALTPKPEKTGLTTADFTDRHLALAYDTGASYPSSIYAIMASSGKLLAVDTMNNRIAVTAGSGSDFVIQGAELGSKEASLVNLAWIMLAIGSIALASLVFLGLFSLYTYRNNMTTFILALLPIAMLILLVLVLIFYNTERNRLLGEQKGLEQKLTAIAKTSAELTDGDALAKTTAKLFQNDFSNLAYKSNVSKTDYMGTSGVLLAICVPYQTYPAVIADNINYFRGGQPMRFVSSRDYAKLLKQEPAFSALRSGDTVKLQASYPIRDSKGGFAGFTYASLTVASPDARGIFRYVLNTYYLYLILAVLGFLAISAGIRLIGSRAQEPAHIIRVDSSDEEAIEADADASPMLDDSDFDIPVIPDTGFKESYSSSNVFDLAELPPLSGVGQPQQNDIDTPKVEGGGQQAHKAKPPLTPAESLFARATSVQAHGTEKKSTSPTERVKSNLEEQSAPVKAAATQGMNNALELHVDAVSALKSGNYSLAVSLLERVIKLTPNDAKALNNLGIAYKRSGNTAKAIQCFEKALAINPTDASLAKNLETLKKAKS